MSQLKFKLISASELAKAIGAIGKRKVALDKAVQVAAVQCVAQSIVHRNATPAMELFAALQGSMRRDALVVYFERFGNLKWNREETAEQKKGLVFHENAKIADDKDAWLATAAETVWYSLKKESPIRSEYDAESVIEKAIDSLHRAAKRGAAIINPEALKVVETAYAQFKAAQLQAQTDPEVQEAIEARAAGQATPSQLAKLTEHFARPMGQVRKAA